MKIIVVSFNTTLYLFPLGTPSVTLEGLLPLRVSFLLSATSVTLVVSALSLPIRQHFCLKKLVRKKLLGKNLPFYCFRCSRSVSFTFWMYNFLLAGTQVIVAELKECQSLYAVQNVHQKNTVFIVFLPGCLIMFLFFLASLLRLATNSQ